MPPGPGQVPNFIVGTVLLFEQPGPTQDTTWPHVLTGITSQGKVAETETVNTGVGYASTFPVSPQITAVTDAVRACGPSTDASSIRDPGCIPDLPQGSPYGAAGSPGYGPAQWAYTGSSLGPPVVPTGEDVLGECSYSLTVEEDTTRGLECRLAPAKGGIPWPAQYADGVAIARFATGGWQLPGGTAVDQLPEVFRVQCVAVCTAAMCMSDSPSHLVPAGTRRCPCAGALSRAPWHRTGC